MSKQSENDLKNSARMFVINTFRCVFTKNSNIGNGDVANMDAEHSCSSINMKSCPSRKNNNHLFISLLMSANPQVLVKVVTMAIGSRSN